MFLQVFAREFLFLKNSEFSSPHEKLKNAVFRHFFFDRYQNLIPKQNKGSRIILWTQHKPSKPREPFTIYQRITKRSQQVAFYFEKSCPKKICQESRFYFISNHNWEISWKQTVFVVTVFRIRAFKQRMFKQLPINCLKWLVLKNWYTILRTFSNFYQKHSLHHVLCRKQAHERLMRA